MRLLWGPHPTSVTRAEVDLTGAIANRLAGGGGSRVGGRGDTLGVSWLVLVGDHVRARRIVRSSAVARRQRYRPRAVVDGPRAVVDGPRAVEDVARATVDWSGAAEDGTGAAEDVGGAAVDGTGATGNRAWATVSVARAAKDVARAEHDGTGVGPGLVRILHVVRGHGGVRGAPSGLAAHEVVHSLSRLAVNPVGCQPSVKTSTAAVQR